MTETISSISSPPQSAAPREIQLHIGGREPHPDWQILDIQPGPNVDYVGNAVDLSQFADNSIQRIYSSHVLEHFSYQGELVAVLKEWYRVLKPMGSLFISVPDLPTLCRLYLSEDLSPQERFQIMRMMFGGQVDPYDYHKVGMSWEVLSYYLGQAGFEMAYPVESFGFFQDCSRIVVRGQLISLNVEAMKGGEEAEDSDELDDGIPE
ncbi:MAG: methyltransferase domain-containing protein [Cyanophyceae cyanobacterium]